MTISSCRCCHCLQSRQDYFSGQLLALTGTGRTDAVSCNCSPLRLPDCFQAFRHAIAGLCNRSLALTQWHNEIRVKYGKQCCTYLRWCHWFIDCSSHADNCSVIIERTSSLTDVLRCFAALFNCWRCSALMRKFSSSAGYLSVLTVRGCAICKTVAPPCERNQPLRHQRFAFVSVMPEPSALTVA